MKRDIEALLAFIDSRQAVPYAWGRKRNDCVGFAIGAVEAQTGEKVARSLKWAGPKAALTIIKRFGSLEAAFDHYFERIPPALAMRGDIAGVPAETMRGLDKQTAKLFRVHPMIVEGMTLVTPGEHGNERVKRSAMTVAWSATEPKRV